MDVNETLCKNPSCRRKVEQVGGGHRKREYCDDTCRQAAHRARQEAARRGLCVEQVSTWGAFQPETIEYLAGWLFAGNEEGARRLAALIASEQRQAPAPSGEVNEKLLQSAARIQKLEKQVEIQRQQIGQYHARFYPSTLAVAEQKLMALGAALNYKFLLKYDAHAVEVGSGEKAWRDFATSATVDDLAQAILQAQHLFDNLYALGMVGKRDSLANND
jgi:hypothetical protein